MQTLRIAITPGEPAGIGPDLLVQIAQSGHEHQLIVIADSNLLLQRAKMLQLPLQLIPLDSTQAPQSTAPSSLYIKPVEMAHDCTAGVLDPKNAHYVLDTLSTAIDGCLNDEFDAMVTAPVNKAVINEAGIRFSGHTEYLAQRTNTPQVVMMLATEGLRVALVTTHLPLKDVAANITFHSVERVTRILHKDLQHFFGLQKPRITVLGLNPHAGEGGHMGREEIDDIIPCMEKLNSEGLCLHGPLPADTAFTEKHLKECDAILAMYHDQGLPVLKYKGFGKAVNVTLGLPIVRTSVDHGTALDLAGSGKADAGSLQTALDYAITMATHKRNQPNPSRRNHNG